MRDPTPPTTPSSQPQLIPTPFPRPPSSSHVLPSADPLTNEVVVATARPSSSSSLASPHTGAPSASVAASSSSSSSSSSSDAARLHATSKMSDVAPESRDDDPSSVSTTKVSNHHHHAPSDSLPSSASSEPPLLHPNPHSTSLQLSIAVASAIPSAHTSPGAQTPELNSTVSTLQLASEALSNIPQQDPNATDVPVTAVQLLSAFQRKSKKVPAIQSPHPGSARSRSAATTPVPPSLLLGLKNDSFDVTAASSRATTPTRTPSGRAKRQRRERNAATPVASVSALPSIEQNDRRRSARVAKAVTASASDSPNMPNLALFGFSPYLENLVMNAKETDRRTRSGGRGIRPPVDRAPTRLKRGTAKSKTKETDPDGPDDEAKIDLYRQLCIISYQLQAHLDMVPHKSLEELRAQFATPPPEEDDGKLPPSASSDNTAAASLDPNGATKPPVPMQKHDQPSEPHPDSSNYQPPIVVKAEPPQSPQLSHLDLQPSKPAFSPESSPEVALMHGLRPTFNDDPPHHPPYAQGGFQSYGSREPNPWPAKVDEVQDEPMSPVFRPARANIMSISALMDGPSRPAKPRTPSPELIRTPPQPEEPLPSFMHEWTEQDEMASQFLSACAAAIPKLDTTELDRLTQIAQLAAFDLEMLSVPSTPRASTPSSGLDEQQRQEAILKFDPRRLNPLDTLDTQQLYDTEEAEYRDELQASEELYESVRYLESFDQVVDEWRAGELARLRLQLELRKAEVDRIWTCDRKFAWSNFVNDRAGELYRRAAMEASHAKWQAEMELDLLAVHRRKTKGFAKLTKDIWVPDAESLADPEAAQLYAKYGRFVSGVKHAVDGPLVRADLRKMRAALRAYKTLSKQADQSKDVAETAGQDDPEVHLQAEGEAAEPAERAAADKAVEAASSEYSSEFEEEEEYDSDSSTASSSSGISSLPAFSSVCSSPVLLSVAGSVDVAASDLVSEIASVRDADMDDDSDDEADESLWARQLRLAASRVQTPAASALPSRAASPATSVKVSSAAKKRDRKRKKRPPPPGARLWKKGRVQQDDTSVAGDEDVDMANDERQTAAKGEWPNGHRDDGAAQKGEDAVHVPLAQSMKPDTSREPTLDEAYRYDRPMHYGGYGMHRPPYAEYGEYERPPYDDLPFHRDYPVPHQYAPSGGGYAPPPMPTYPNAADAPYVGTPPPPTQHDFAQPPVYPSYNQYAPAPGTYPSHPPPPPPAAGAGAGPGRPQWPY